MQFHDDQQGDLSKGGKPLQKTNRQFILFGIIILSKYWFYSKT